jgi:MFS family permease
VKSAVEQRWNVALLASAEALFQTTMIMLLILSGLVGRILVLNQSLATLPLAMITVVAAIAMLPASALMQRVGRKVGFLLGASLGAAAGLLAAVAVEWRSFWLFVIAHMLVGGYQSFAQFYRFSAADAVDANSKSRAISWVVAGGVVAAVAGPNLARLTQAVNPEHYAVSYVVLSTLGVVAFALVSRLTLPPVAASAQGSPRRLPQIMRQPIFLIAVTTTSVGFAVMRMIMTATPLAMRLCGQPLGASATVIQWHVLGMFVPSFFTGRLIRRFGVRAIVSCGIGLLAASNAFANSGTSFGYFISCLVLLGIGWNFMFIGGTTLLTDAYRPVERGKTQAAHDLIMLGAVSLGSLSAGGVLNGWGWRGVNLTAVPFLVLAAVAVAAMGIIRPVQSSTVGLIEKQQ